MIIVESTAVPSSASESTQAAMAKSTTTTLYPKITTHVKQVVKALKDLDLEPTSPRKDVVVDPLPIVGTVKLHGTHADILIYSDDRIVFQSRNLTDIDAAKDNAGFAKAMSNKSEALLRLRDLFVARFTELNPDTPINSTKPILIAGEWIGAKVQKDVAISQLTKRFVIISTNINEHWQKDSDYGDIALPKNDIYNISRAGVYKYTLYPDDLHRTTSGLQSFAEDVAKQCPFAATFGVNGEGEGIVWKPALPPHNANPDLWFKTKGGRFKPTFAPQPSKSQVSREDSREVAAAVAKIWTSERRLQQGLDYMEEMQAKKDMKGLSAFLKWVQNDILVEEKEYIKEHGVDAVDLRIEISKIAKKWYGDMLGK